MCVCGRGQMGVRRLADQLMQVLKGLCQARSESRSALAARRHVVRLRSAVVGEGDASPYNIGGM